MVESESLSFDDRKDCVIHRHAKHVVDPDRGSPLGHGSQGIVRSVHFPYNRGGSFAAKFIRRDRLTQFKNELEILRRLEHKHVIEFWGSYSDEKTFAFLFKPVARTDLRAYLAEPPQHPSDLSQFHGCLAAGVRWLHEHDIRHKDIKPGNILIHGTTVLICDFGSALDSSRRDTSQTEGPTGEITRQYLSPEAAHYQPRNEKSDIWSLGTVCLELMTIEAGISLSELHAFLSGKPNVTHCYWVRPELLSEWITRLEEEDGHQQVPAQWVRQMVSTDTWPLRISPLYSRASLQLLKDPDSRPSAVDLLRMIQTSCQGDRPYIGACCASTDLPSTSPSNEESSGRDYIKSIVSGPTTSNGSFSEGRQIPDSPSSRSSTQEPPPNHVPESSTPSISPSQETPPSPPSTQDPLARDGELVCKQPLTTYTYVNLSAASRPADPSLFGIVEVALREKRSANFVLSVRELVLRSKLAGDDPHTIEHKFWIPLSEVKTEIHGTQVEISWSDCDHLERAPTQDGTWYYRRVYSHSMHNNTVQLVFLTEAAASEFTHKIHTPGQAPPDPSALNYSTRAFGVGGGVGGNSEETVQLSACPGSNSAEIVIHSSRVPPSTQVTRLYLLQPETDISLGASAVRGVCIRFFAFGVPNYSSTANLFVFHKEETTRGFPAAEVSLGSQDVEFIMNSTDGKSWFLHHSLYYSRRIEIGQPSSQTYSSNRPK
jgi:serine/threonine protein kinase